MNILFVTLSDIRSIENKGIYSDLMRYLQKDGHALYIISPVERRGRMMSQMFEERYETGKNVHILKLKTGNIQKTNLIEKGLSTLLLEHQIRWGICKYLKDVRFDLVLYSTPPITLNSPIAFIKKRDNARTYLMLKDIFPQNAVDLGMMQKNGIKGFIYRYFRAKEKKLYALSDRIGCMSQANVDYVLQHNPEVDSAKVEVCPNSVELRDLRVDSDTRKAMRAKYGLPLDKRIFVYGGNLGKPQGITHLIECLRTQKNKSDRFFLVVGTGTEYEKLENFTKENQENFKLLPHLPKADYDGLMASCDVGLIFLDHRFTIPNFPSRLLPYMQAGLPVLCCTDPNTDIGQVCEDGGFGWWCESDDPQKFSQIADKVCKIRDLKPLSMKAIAYLKTHYTVARSADVVLQAFIQKQSELSIDETGR